LIIIRTCAHRTHFIAALADFRVSKMKRKGRSRSPKFFDILTSPPECDVHNKDDFAVLPSPAHIYGVPNLRRKSMLDLYLQSRSDCWHIIPYSFLVVESEYVVRKARDGNECLQLTLDLVPPADVHDAGSCYFPQFDADMADESAPIGRHASSMKVRPHHRRLYSYHLRTVRRRRGRPFLCYYPSPLLPIASASSHIPFPIFTASCRTVSILRHVLAPTKCVLESFTGLLCFCAYF
jgi:hypothetical protein